MLCLLTLSHHLALIVEEVDGAASHDDGWLSSRIPFLKSNFSQFYPPALYIPIRLTHYHCTVLMLTLAPVSGRQCSTRPGRCVSVRAVVVISDRAFIWFGIRSLSRKEVIEEKGTR